MEWHQHKNQDTEISYQKKNKTLLELLRFQANCVSNFKLILQVYRTFQWNCVSNGRKSKTSFIK